MSELSLVVVAGLITFASRASYLWRRSSTVPASPFLEVFPLALFVSLATVGLAAPDGTLEVGPGIAAGIGGILGAVLGRRRILWVIGAGAAAFAVARLV